MKRRQETFSWKRIVLLGGGISSALTLITGCVEVNISKFVAQKCLVGETSIVNGLAIASGTFTLKRGQELPIGHATLVGTGDGNFAIKVNNSSARIENLLDGRVIIGVSNGAAWNPDKVLALKGANIDGQSRVVVTQNCNNPTIVPPATE